MALGVLISIDSQPHVNCNAEISEKYSHFETLSFLLNVSAKGLNIFSMDKMV